MIRTPLVAALLVLLGVRGEARGNTPPDPFAAEYALGEPDEVGTAAGQVRLQTGSGVARGDGWTWIAQSTIELMTAATVGLRFSSTVTLLRQEASDPFRWSWTTGPAFHLLPYRRVDLSVFVEGGAVWLDPADGAVSPVIAPGVGMELWLSSALYVRIEAIASWSIDRTRTPARSRVWLDSLLGLGVGL